jgi:hypothetical protein
LSAFLEAQFGWRGACFVWAALQIGLGVPLNLMGIPRGNRASSELSKSTAKPAPEPEAPRHAMLVLGFFFSLVWFVTGAMAAHLPRLLEVAGATASAAILASTLVGPAQVAARLAEYGFLRKFHPLVSARAAALGHPLGALTLLVFGGPAAFAFAILHGAGNGVLTIARDVATRDFRAGGLWPALRFARRSRPRRTGPGAIPFWIGHRRRRGGRPSSIERIERSGFRRAVLAPYSGQPTRGSTLTGRFVFNRHKEQQGRGRSTCPCARWGGTRRSIRGHQRRQPAPLKSRRHPVKTIILALATVAALATSAQAGGYGHSYGYSNYGYSYNYYRPTYRTYTYSYEYQPSYSSGYSNSYGY